MTVTVLSVTIRLGSTFLLLSDQSRLDAGSRRHRGLLFATVVKFVYSGAFLLCSWAKKTLLAIAGEQGEKVSNYLRSYLLASLVSRLPSSR